MLSNYFGNTGKFLSNFSEVNMNYSTMGKNKCTYTILIIKFFRMHRNH